MHVSGTFKCMDEVLTIVEARSRLTELVRRVSETPGLRIYLGPRRKRDAVLMASSREMPDRIRRLLFSAFAAHEAELAIRGGASRDDFLHAGDPMGIVVAWLWNVDREFLPSFLADYLSQLRDHNPRRPKPQITLENVLTALRIAMPQDFERRDFEALCAMARVEVEPYYGPGPND